MSDKKGKGKLEDKRYSVETHGTPDRFGPPEIERLSASLEVQLASEEDMVTDDDLSRLETQYYAEKDNKQHKFAAATAFCRSKKRENKLRGLRWLSELEKDKQADPRSLNYYLALVNYKLHFWAEAKRYVLKLLEEEPANRQAMAFRCLLDRRSQRKYLVCVNGSEESDLAFHRALELCKPWDELIIYTGIKPAEVEKKMPPGFEDNISLRRQTVDELTERTQGRYRTVLDNRGAQYKTVTEEGEPKHDIIALVVQENVDTVLIGFGSAKGAGYYARATMSSTASHLFHNAPCDVVVVKTPAHLQTPPE